MNKAKPFGVAKREVWEAFKQVKANRGVAGVDGQSIEDFERDLSNNLCRISFTPDASASLVTDGLDLSKINSRFLASFHFSRFCLAAGADWI